MKMINVESASNQCHDSKKCRLGMTWGKVRIYPEAAPCCTPYQSQRVKGSWLIGIMDGFLNRPTRTEPMCEVTATRGMQNYHKETLNDYKTMSTFTHFTNVPLFFKTVSQSGLPLIQKFPNPALNLSSPSPFSKEHHIRSDISLLSSQM